VLVSEEADAAKRTARMAHDINTDIKIIMRVPHKEPHDATKLLEWINQLRFLWTVMNDSRLLELHVTLVLQLEQQWDNVHQQHLIAWTDEMRTLLERLRTKFYKDALLLWLATEERRLRPMLQAVDRMRVAKGLPALSKILDDLAPSNAKFTPSHTLTVTSLTLNKKKRSFLCASRLRLVFRNLFFFLYIYRVRSNVLTSGGRERQGTAMLHL